MFSTIKELTDELVNNCITERYLFKRIVLLELQRRAYFRQSILRLNILSEIIS